MEARQLFSGGVEAFLVTQLDNPVATYINVDNKLEPTAASQTPIISGDVNKVETKANEIVFIDSGIKDFQSIVNDITRNGTSGRQFEIVLLDKSQDGIAQITQTLSDYKNLAAVHLITHGSDGSMDIGNNQLNFQTLVQNQATINAWGNAFAENGDFLIYGCNVAETQFGQGFIDYLSTVTSITTH